MKLGRAGGHRSVLAGGLVTVVCGALVGCGGSSDDDDASAGGTTEITVTSSGVFLTSAPLYIAEEMGFFAEENLTVNVTTTQGGATATSALFGGSAQVALAGFNQVPQATANGQPVMGFAATNDQLPLQVVVSNELYDEHQLATADITAKIEALRGRKLGVVSPNGQNGLVFDTLFSMVGTDREGSGAEYIVLGDPNTIVTAFRQGEVDAFNLNPFYPDDVQNTGDGHIIIDVAKGEVPALDGMVNSGFFATPSYIAEHGEVLQRFTNAIAAAERWEAENPAEAVELLHETVFQQTPLELLQPSFEALVANGGLSPAPVIDPSGFEKFVNFILSAPEAPELQVPVTELYTNQFATAAEAEVDRLLQTAAENE
jgi:NitT/TauT family transport system substrate-binding protein